MIYLLDLLRGSLKLRLVTYFLLLSLTASSLVGLLVSFQARQVVQNNLFQRLEAVAIVKQDSIETWVQEQAQTLEFLAQTPEFEQRALRLLIAYQAGLDEDDPHYRAVYDDMQAYLAVVQNHYPSFNELMLVSRFMGGKVVAAIDPAREADYLHDATYVVNAYEATYIHKLHAVGDPIAPTQTVAAPIRDAMGQTRGVAVAHLNLERLEKIIATAGLGETGEVYLVEENSARIRQGQFGLEAWEWGGELSEAILRGQAGESGAAMYDNYDGTPVLGAYRWIEQFRVIVMVEMDRAEALRSVNRIAWITLALGVSSAALLTGGAWLLVGSAVRPILQLTETAVQISRGDLSSTAPITSSDEVGLLAQAFNQMTIELNLLYDGLQKKVHELQQAEASLRQYTHRLEAQHKIDRAILAAQSPEEIASAAMTNLRRLVQCRRASVTLFDYEAEQFVVLAIDTAAPSRIDAGHRGALTEWRGLSRLRRGDIVYSQEAGGAGSEVPHMITLQEEGVKHYVNLPLQIEGEVIGSLNLGGDDLSLFTKEHIVMAREVADQISIAIRQTQLLTAIQRQLQELSVLHAVATAGAEALDETALIERVTEVIGATLRPDSYGILLSDERRNGLYVVPSYRGVHERLKRIVIPLHRGVAGRVAQTGRSLRLGDVWQAPYYLMANSAVRSELCVPIIIGDELIGVINVESVAKDAFTAADERLLVTLAGQLATAVQKVRLFARAEQEIRERRRAEQALRQARDELELRVAERTAELTLLINASQTLISTLDQDELFERVLEELRNMLQVFACSVWLLSENGRELICRQISGVGRERALGWRLPANAGLVGWVAQNGRSLIVADALQEALDEPSLRLHTPPAARSALLAPLLVRGRVIGVLQALHTEPTRFSPSDLAVVESLAATAAFAIDNSRLYNLARHEAETKSILLREVNHRVKNNLTAVSGLLYAEQRHAGMRGDAVYQSIMKDLIGRVQSLSTVHDLLSASEWQPISLTELTERLIYAAVKPSDKQFRVEVARSDALLLPEHASKLALVINELATNCLKYAASERETARIAVEIVTRGDDVTIVFADNGPGFPDEILNAEAPRYNVGFHLVKNIIERMGGRLTLANGRNGAGAVVTIRFNLKYETAYSMGTTIFKSEK